MAIVMEDHILDQHEKDQGETPGCIGSSEFEGAVRRVGKRSYAQIHESLQQFTQNTVCHLVTVGAPTPEDFIRRVSGNKKR